MDKWTDETSDLYRHMAAVAVPARDEQMATMLALIPFGLDETFHAVEIGCGEGYLASSLLQCYPRATLTALDGSATMRATTAQRLHAFSGRTRVEPFDLLTTDWFTFLDGVDCILSSLCLHHLSGPQKRTLYSEAAQRTSRLAALLIADLVAAQRREALNLFAATWDRCAEAQSHALTGTEDGFSAFVETEWNYYRFPDPFDKPSGLFEQLLWLRDAGFAVVDCFWMQAGHAIYGAYKTSPDAPVASVPFEQALETARTTLQAR